MNLDHDDIYNILQELPDYQSIRNFCTSSKRINDICNQPQFAPMLNEQYVDYVIRLAIRKLFTEEEKELYLKTKLTDRIFRFIIVDGRLAIMEELKLEIILGLMYKFPQTLQT